MKLKYHSVCGHVPIHDARGHILTGLRANVKKTLGFFEAVLVTCRDFFFVWQIINAF